MMLQSSLIEWGLIYANSFLFNVTIQEQLNLLDYRKSSPVGTLTDLLCHKVLWTLWDVFVLWDRIFTRVRCKYTSLSIVHK